MLRVRDDKLFLYVNVLSFCCVFVDSVTEMLLCSACVALGISVSTSATMRTSPLSGTLDRPTLIILSAALGRFIFTVVHQLGQLGRGAGPDVSAWTGFRAVYVIVSVICLSVVILTGDILVLGAIVLLLELGIAVEEASRAVERLSTDQDASTTHIRLQRGLTLTGILLVVVHILLPTTLLVIAICVLDSPFELGPPEVGLLCFAVVFFTLSALVVLRRLLDRSLPQRRRRPPIVSQPPNVPAKPATTSRLKVVVRRRPLVEGMSVDGRRRRSLRRPGVEFLLHAVRGRRVCSIDVYNAIRVAAASTKGLDNSISSHQRQLTAAST